MSKEQVLEFLEKNLRKSELALNCAKSKPNISSIEIENINKKILIWQYLIELVIGGENK